MSLTSDKTLFYNAKDAAATLVIANKFIPELKGTPLEATYRHTMDLWGPLSYMMIRGVKIDLVKLEELKVKVDGLITQYQIKLNALCGRPLNVNSPADVKKYFYIEKGVAPYTKRAAKGSGSSVTVDDKAMQRLSRGTSTRKGFEEARIIQRIRQLRKLKGTYLDIIFDSDKRLRCSYQPRGTKFGRLSSSKTIFETGMNMQNLPPAFQQFLVADEGKVFLSFDKRQAEWVIVAYATGDASMIKAVEMGVDVHSYTASEMFKVPIDIIKREHKLIGSESDPEAVLQLRKSADFMHPYLHGWLPRTMSMRQCGKKSNHGLNYDETEKMFSLINEISEKEATVIINFYHNIYPGIRRWYGTIQQKLAQDRTLYNMFGRPYKFLDKWGPDLFKSAYSFIPQSTVGELVNRAMVAIYNDNAPELSTYEILKQTHDSLEGQISVRDPATIVQAVRRITKHMNPTLEAGGRSFVVETDLKIGFTMGTMTEINLSLSDADLQLAIEQKLNEQKASV